MSAVKKPVAKKDAKPNLFAGMTQDLTVRKAGDFLIESTVKTVVGGGIAFGLYKGGSALKTKWNNRSK